MARTSTGWGVGPVLWKWASVQPWRHLVEVNFLVTLIEISSSAALGKVLPDPFEFQIPVAWALKMVVCFHVQLLISFNLVLRTTPTLMGLFAKRYNNAYSFLMRSWGPSTNQTCCIWPRVPRTHCFSVCGVLLFASGNIEINPV